MNLLREDIFELGVAHRLDPDRYDVMVNRI